MDANSPAKGSAGGLWLKIALLAVVILFGGYSVIAMYASGEYAFAIVTLLLISLGVYVFTNPRTYAHRYIFPGVAGMAIFIVFPMAYTVFISFTNYSGVNLLSLERAQNYLRALTYQADGGSFEFSMHPTDSEGRYILALKSEQDESKIYVSHSVEILTKKEITAARMRKADWPMVENGVELVPATALPTTPAEAIRTIVQTRDHLSALKLNLPDGDVLSMNGLRKFSALKPVYTLLDQGAIIADQIIISDSNTLRDNRSGELLRPNMNSGYYQYVDNNGQFVGERIPPGFTVGVGWKNYLRVMTDKGIQGPFLQIFVWTVVFAGASVGITLMIGMIMACLVQWEHLKGRALYRVFLILPYAVPAFISILVFKGLFNQNFGEINLALESIFGIKPEWYTDPVLAKLMILIVNTWLGYPYMMILCMGLLKSIPEDLYEASAMDGSGPVGNFFKITVPLLMKPLTPLLIASFAFNFNNFVLILLLTNGDPDIIGATTPAGHTDLLVSYTYRIAFEGSGQDYGLASAIATLIFLMVGALAILNLKLSKADH
ncbi:maltose ABC transporter permease MalF [Echinimonas agarilytica]|uniref:Maltose/maltodextrin transport system permease protein n=1 Tax=Echinimonas agarilytica TaxID=1215918 RepID=A0AA42B7E0_9GAMM|nr:maltose ABC transporter permease MalF [Echinimonas agarilytica]MCM2679840.1 maltose ABC transporter permease MalF [Echinimonas agarilytica]